MKYWGILFLFSIIFVACEEQELAKLECSEESGIECGVLEESNESEIICTNNQIIINNRCVDTTSTVAIPTENITLLPVDIKSVAIKGDKMVAVGQSQILLYDISDVNNPILISKSFVPNMALKFKMNVYWNKNIYIVNKDHAGSNIIVMKLINDNNIKRLANLKNNSAVSTGLDGLSLVGDIVYKLASKNGSVGQYEVYDYRNSDNPTPSLKEYSLFPAVFLKEYASVCVNVYLPSVIKVLDFAEPLKPEVSSLVWDQANESLLEGEGSCFLADNSIRTVSFLRDPNDSKNNVKKLKVMNISDEQELILQGEIVLENLPGKNWTSFLGSWSGRYLITEKSLPDKDRGLGLKVYYLNDDNSLQYKLSLEKQLASSHHLIEVFSKDEAGRLTFLVRDNASGKFEVNNLSLTDDLNIVVADFETVEIGQGNIYNILIKNKIVRVASTYKALGELNDNDVELLRYSATNGYEIVSSAKAPVGYYMPYYGGKSGDSLLLYFLEHSSNSFGYRNTKIKLMGERSLDSELDFLNSNSLISQTNGNCVPEGFESWNLASVLISKNFQKESNFTSCPSLATNQTSYFKNFNFSFNEIDNFLLDNIDYKSGERLHEAGNVSIRYLPGHVGSELEVRDISSIGNTNEFVRKFPMTGIELKSINDHIILGDSLYMAVSIGEDFKRNLYKVDLKNNLEPVEVLGFPTSENITINTFKGKLLVGFEDKVSVYDSQGMYENDLSVACSNLQVSSDIFMCDNSVVLTSTNF